MNQQQKDARVERAERHEKQDLLISGSYIEKIDGVPKGCSVGCDLIDIERANGLKFDEISDENCHLKVAEHDGTAEWIEKLRDAVYEGLPQNKKSKWHVDLAKALPVEVDRVKRFGAADWKPYFHQIAIALINLTLEHRKHWQDPHKSTVESSLKLCIEHHLSPSKESASAARHAARHAARSAGHAARSAGHAAESARHAVEFAGYAKYAVAAGSVRCAVGSVRCAVEFAGCAKYAAAAAAYERISVLMIEVFTGND